MTTQQTTLFKTPFALDIKQTLSKNRLTGMWRLLHGFRWYYLGATFCQAISALAKTGTFFLLRYFIDQVLGQGKFNVLIWMALGFIGMAATEGSFSFLTGRLAAKTAEGLTQRLRNYMYDHIQRLSFAYHAQTKTGELIERCTSDIDAVRTFFSDQAIGVGRIILLFVINFVAIWNLSWKLAFVSIVIAPVIVLVSAFFFKRISKVYEAYQEQEATLQTTLQENLTGVRVVKAFARQDYERNKFEKDNWEKFLRGRRLTLMHTTFWPVTDTICSIQLITGLIIAGLFVISKSITIGDYMAYAGMLMYLIWPMRNLGRLIVQASSGLVSYNRVMEIVRQDQEPLFEGDYLPKESVKGDVTFKEVSFAYTDAPETPVLKNISFHCESGRAVALLGSTGSGKTTLVNLLPRFYDYTSGSLTLDGIELNRYPRHFLRQQIGIVEQEPFLFSRSIRENITYGVGRDIPDEEVEAAARAAAIHDVILTFPDGYKTLVGEKGVTLSGGQKQRVAIARTLLKNPRILILDDSTSSVDIETEAEIRQALEHLMKNRTTFIIAHRIQSVMNADLILVIDKGGIVQTGSHDELVTQPGIYRQIYDIQTRIEVELDKEMATAMVEGS